MKKILACVLALLLAVTSCAFALAEGGLAGSTLRFETTDTNGNPVKSEELFGAHAVTMLNIWATWCGPCMYEMPELGKLGRSLAADGKDAAIVGICIDAAEHPEDCQKALTENQIEYLNLLADNQLMVDLNVMAIPKTFFVDRNGKVLVEPIEGVPNDLSFYGKSIDYFLADAPAKTASAEPAAVSSVYRVIVTDQNGDPVPGVMVQFCDDTACMMGITAEDGITSFPDAAEGHPYTVHILKAPEGYEGTEEEFTVPATFCDTVVTLQKSN